MKALVVKFTTFLNGAEHHNMLLRWFATITLFSILSIASLNAFATNYYVDQACANAGNGTADQCANAAGGAGAFKKIQ